jgi:hypothetical protein
MAIFAERGGRRKGPRPINCAAGRADAGATLLTVALRYHRQGWCIIPVIGKKAACPWTKYQKRRPSRKELRRLFARPDVTGLAVVLGRVSGGLVCRDFDTKAGYRKWAMRHEDDAAGLPTAKTRRGFHVFFIGPEGFQKVDGRYGPGEYRGTCGQYVVLPPSAHPDGGQYEWVNVPDAGVPPVDDPVKRGLAAALPKSSGHSAPGPDGAPTAAVPLRSGHRAPRGTVDTQDGTDRSHRQTYGHSHPQRTQQGTQRTQRTQRTQTFHVSARRSVSTGSAGSVLKDPAVAERVAAAIEATLPTVPGKRHYRLFALARHLKAIPALAMLPAEALEPTVREWYERALPVIRTKDYAESWREFRHGWDRVKRPVGSGPIDKTMRRAEAMMAAFTPRFLTRLYPNAPVLIRLAALCWRLQDKAKKMGRTYFHLDVRTAGWLLDVGRTRAWSLLNRLCADGVLERGKVGEFGSRRASEYRWCGNPAK